MRYALLLISLLMTMTAYADDTSSIDSIVNAHYEVVSGPEGFIYDADRDTNIHADGCLLYTSPSPRDPTSSRMPSSA